MFLRVAAAFSLLLLYSLKMRAEQMPIGGGNRQFAVSLPPTLPSDSITGRVFLLVARNRGAEPRLQRQNVSMFAIDFRGAKAGEVARFGSTTPGYPEHSLGELPAGDYCVQAVLNVYTEFHRADGHVIWAHMDQWEGQNFRISPGNLCSDSQMLHLDPKTTNEFKMTLDKVIPAIEVPADSKWVKHVKFESKLLSRFWGHPIYIGATVLLPKDYDTRPDIRYPVIYQQGHFGLGPPFAFTTEPDKPGTKTWASQRKEWIAGHPQEWAAGHLNMPEPPSPSEANQNMNALDVLQYAGATFESGQEFYEAWSSDDFPRMIAVTFQHPTPYFDDSYAVNSANCGPYGDAIMQELIPYVEEHFRVLSRPYARVLTGGSTGGWEALALQIYHPEFFGGSWGLCPDSVDFRRYYGGLDLYSDDNAYVDKAERYFRGGAKLHQEWSQMSSVLGVDDGPFQWWIYTPTGSDGYPVPVWNLATGKIDRVAVQYMKDHNYDLRDYLERNWPQIGPNLKGKLHVICGDDDGVYENLAVYLFEDFLESTKEPYYGGSFTYGRPMKVHGWQPTSNADLIRTMARFVADHSPDDAPTTWWVGPHHDLGVR